MRGFVPAAATLKAAERLERHVAWSEGFWLAFVFTIEPPQANLVQARVAAALLARGRDLRVLHPEAPQELEAALTEIVAGPEWGCTWVDAIRDRGADSGAWTQAWIRLLLRANSRRELLRSRLQGGLVFVAHPDIKADLRAAAPDLWSVRTLVADLPATEGRIVEDVGDTVLIFEPGNQPDSELLDEDLRRVDLLDKVPPVQQARGLSRLVNRLFAAGRHEVALTLTQRVVELYRDLAEQDPEAFLYARAEALQNLATLQQIVAQHEQSLLTAQESVELWRRLASANPGAFDEDLALALINFGWVSSEQGLPEQALPATQEAIHITRARASMHSEARGLLALGLDNLGVQLGALGRSAEAVEAAREALEHYRQLVEERPDTFAPHLARALVNLGMVFLSLGRLEEAQAATEEGLDRYRDLSSVSPNRFFPEVARTLGALGSIQRERGDLPAALSAYGEGVRILEPFARGTPAAFDRRFQKLVNGLKATCKEGGLTPPSDLVHLLEDP